MQKIASIILPSSQKSRHRFLLLLMTDVFYVRTTEPHVRPPPTAISLQQQQLEQPISNTNIIFQKISQSTCQKAMNDRLAKNPKVGTLCEMHRKRTGRNALVSVVIMIYCRKASLLTRYNLFYFLLNCWSNILKRYSIQHNSYFITLSREFFVKIGGFSPSHQLFSFEFPDSKNCLRFWWHL